jgi:hypothetical protein
MSNQKSNFHAFQDRVREKDYEIAEGIVGMDEKMRKRMEALSRITTQNGATNNEEQIAQRKMKAMKKAQLRKESFTSRVEAVSNPTKVNVYPLNEDVPPQDVAFAKQFEEIRRANRKKWNVK